MKLLSTALLMTLFFLPSPLWAEATDPTCEINSVERQKFMKMDYKSFDQTLPDGGWRKYYKDNCYLAVARIIDEYRITNHKKLFADEVRILTWHAGQAYAMDGRDTLALERFKKSFDPEEIPENKFKWDFKWNIYVKGTIAFMENDYKTLKQSRDELQKHDKNHPNLKVLNNMMDCYGRPYKEVGHCNPTSNHKETASGRARE